jgi:hypothetical protein
MDIIQKRYNKHNYFSYLKLRCVLRVVVAVVETGAHHSKLFLSVIFSLNNHQLPIVLHK